MTVRARFETSPSNEYLSELNVACGALASESHLVGHDGDASTLGQPLAFSAGYGSLPAAMGSDAVGHG